MNRNVTIGIAAVVIIVVGGIIWFATRQTTTTNTNATTPSQSQTSTSSTVQTTDQMVSIQDMAFSPNVLTIKKGVKVTWTNQDSVGHNIIGDDASLSGGLPAQADVLSNGQSYSHTFDTVGTFAYHCGVHPGMTGTVEVVE